MALRQAVIPDRLLGRVMDAWRMIVYGAIPLGSLSGGLLARLLSVRATFVIGGAAFIGLALVSRRAIAAADGEHAASAQLPHRALHETIDPRT